MILDHIAYLFLPFSWVYICFRFIGRVCAPIMFFSLANGFLLSKNKFNYFKRLLIFVIASQVPYSLFMYNCFWMIDKYNVLFTLLIGFMCLYTLTNDKVKLVFKIILNLFLFGLVCFCDYGLFGILCIFIFYFINHIKLRCILYSLYITLMSKSIALYLILSGLFLVVPLLCLYNGEKGKLKLKYFFYVFYPSHFLVLFIIKILL